jgi:hypothetical protein
MKDKLLAYAMMVRNLVGNNKPATIGIAAFILLVIIVSCHPAKAAAHIDLFTGASFGQGSNGAVLGLDLSMPVTQYADIYAGTDLWGKTNVVANNWDWHIGFESCRGRLCAGLGAAYLEKTDALDGAHTNFYLRLDYHTDWGWLHSAQVHHISDAGTVMPNYGRQAAGPVWRLQ